MAQILRLVQYQSSLLQIHHTLVLLSLAEPGGRALLVLFLDLFANLEAKVEQIGVGSEVARQVTPCALPALLAAARVIISFAFLLEHECFLVDQIRTLASPIDGTSLKIFVKELFDHLIYVGSGRLALM